MNIYVAIAVLVIAALGLWLRFGIPVFSRPLASVLDESNSDEDLRDRTFKKRKAVIVAINKWADGDTLAGCDRDGANVLQALCARWGIALDPNIWQEYWKGESGWYKRISGKDYDIRIVRNNRATAAFAKRLINWLYSGTQSGDVRLLYWSGHGTQVPSTTEADGLDEALVPYDFDWDKPDTQLRDDVVAAAKTTVPSGANCTIPLDTCHSANFLRTFERGHEARYKIPPVRITEGRTVKHSFAKDQEHDSFLLLSGCTADSVSYTGKFEVNGRAVSEGALTHNFLKCLRETPSAPMRELHQRVHDVVANSKYKQEPQLEGSQRLMDKPFLEA
jgi:hypothetical protein